MPETLRTFIAVPLSKAVTQELDKLQRRLMRSCPARAVRWVPAENIHLTVHFLGDILPERIEPIKEALTVVARNVPPFPFTAGQLGAFPNMNRPRVVWVGISDTASWLALLHEAVDVAFSASRGGSHPISRSAGYNAGPAQRTFATWERRCRQPKSAHWGSCRWRR